MIPLLPITNCEDKSHTFIRNIVTHSEQTIEEFRAKGLWLPHTHQIVWCVECSKIVSQENNEERKRMSLEFRGIH